jgi:hypothetical protein
MSQPPNLRKLPIGVADFATIRNPEKNFVCADKIKIFHESLQNPDKPCFLSRPRHFGKTLLVSTLEAIPHARRDLFEERQDESTGRFKEGLWIAGPESSAEVGIPSAPRAGHQPLVNVASTSVEKLENQLNLKLDPVALDENLELKGDEPPVRLAELMRKLSMRYDPQKVAVLIEKYDATVLRGITNPVLAVKIRNALAAFSPRSRTSRSLEVLPSSLASPDLPRRHFSRTSTISTI